jgi:hypothetical protein
MFEWDNYAEFMCMDKFVWAIIWWIGAAASVICVWVHSDGVASDHTEGNKVSFSPDRTHEADLDPPMIAKVDDMQSNTKLTQVSIHPRC